MANDPTQDKDFLAAPPERQHAYLMATDPDYAKAPPERQKAYLASFAAPNLKTGAGMENYAQKQAGQYGAERATAPYEAQQEELQRRKNLAVNWEQGNPTPVTNAAAVYAAPMATREGLKRGAAFLARTALGSAGGAYGGGHVGKYLGGEQGEQIGKVIGGVAGGYLGATGRYLPSRYSLMERLLASGQPEATSAEAAAAAKIPASEPGVTVVPEPRPALPGDKPAAMWSVGRESQLPQAAQQGVPGAADVLRNTGRTVLFTPREGTGFPAARSRTLFPEPSPMPPVVQSEGAPPPVPTSTPPATTAASPAGGPSVPPTMPPPPEGAVLDRGTVPWDEEVKRRGPGELPMEPTPQSPKEAKNVEAAKRREATSRAALNKKEQR